MKNGTHGEGTQSPWCAWRELARRSLAVCAAGLVLPAAVACKERSPSQGNSGPALAAKGSAGSSEDAVSPEPAMTPARRTTRGQMLSHYSDTAAMRQGLIAGRIADYQAAAAAVAADEWASADEPGAREWWQRARAAAHAAAAASSLVEAAEALAALGDTCASCHLASDAPQPAVAPDESNEASNPRMLAHAVAASRLWAGLTLPSDDSWASGTRLLLQDPALADPSPEVAEAARYLQQLARRAERTEPDQRSRLFADILLTCSGCHERLGIPIENGVVVR